MLSDPAKRALYDRLGRQLGGLSQPARAPVRGRRECRVRARQPVRAGFGGRAATFATSSTRPAMPASSATSSTPSSAGASEPRRGPGRGPAAHRWRDLRGHPRRDGARRRRRRRLRRGAATRADSIRGDRQPQPRAGPPRPRRPPRSPSTRPITARPASSTSTGSASRSRSRAAPTPAPGSADRQGAGRRRPARRGPAAPDAALQAPRRGPRTRAAADPGGSAPRCARSRSDTPRAASR